jgi:hypothetical protein
LEGLLANIEGLGAYRDGRAEPDLGRPSWRMRGPTDSDRARPSGPTMKSTRAIAAAVSLLVALALLAGAPAAQASEAQTIIEKCGHGEQLSGYTQNAYREALKHMPTEVSEYTDCANQIRKAELAAAGGGGGSAPASGPSTNVALPLTPSEQRAVQSARHSGSAPIQVGNEPIQPGVVHADISSAVNTLPHSLIAVLAFLVAGAVLVAVGEVGKRVRARRHG